MIRLHIVPEFGILVSQDALKVLIGQDKTGQDAFQNVLGVPTVDIRRADTTAMVKDGQTIVIGGLRKREIQKTFPRCLCLVIYQLSEVYSNLKPNRR